MDEVGIKERMRMRVDSFVIASKVEVMFIYQMHREI